MAPSNMRTGTVFGSAAGVTEEAQRRLHGLCAERSLRVAGRAWPGSEWSPRGRVNPCDPEGTQGLVKATECKAGEPRRSARQSAAGPGGERTGWAEGNGHEVGPEARGQ